jgi:hypothetical protein
MTEGIEKSASLPEKVERLSEEPVLWEKKVVRPEERMLKNTAWPVGLAVTSGVTRSRSGLKERSDEAIAVKDTQPQ